MQALRETYPGKVPIHLANGAAFLWNVEGTSMLTDVELARTQHHICGFLGGTLPLIPQQNVFLGLPLRLIPEEVTLLLRQNAGILIDDANAFYPVSDDERKAYLDAEAASIAAQKERAIKQQQENRERAEAALAVQGDSALERRRARLAKKGGEMPQQVPETADRAPYLHITQGTPDFTPGFVPRTQRMCEPGQVPNAYESLQEAFNAGVWKYPATLAERARCAVFEDLHKRGYFMSTGLRFGGDYVVYPGDPLRYHSHFTAMVLASHDEPLPAFNIVASGRLGTAVKKSHLICSVTVAEPDDEAAAKSRAEGHENEWGSVEYWSLSWAGFGT